ncbi:MAG TPA: tRNA pseudouridine(38-40) synthase TruA [Saprospiraceae bacterium]|nr:tRNA pseudouridine(38-40) synthase TruA [Saprospiraceae bacterium]
MRYLLRLAYNGTRFSGWQIQPNATTVQETIELALSKLFNRPISIVGCGRTDAGVHAEEYYAHFDTEKTLEHLPYKLNRILSKDISIKSAEIVADNLHARFDARQRSYIYRIKGDKDPFRQEWITTIAKFDELDTAKMQKAAKLLLDYDDFFSFCKTGGNNQTTICHLTQAEWVFLPEKREMIFHISADRFLRGMVRLIVGMCLNVGYGKISMEEVRYALETKTRLPQSLSVPSNGLSLNGVAYE